MRSPYQTTRPTTQISSEQTPVAMIMLQEETIYSCFSNPTPTSQARWRMPLKKWYIRATVQPNRQNSPTGEPMNHCTLSNAWSEEAAATSHQVSSNVPTATAQPVTRCRIEV